MAPATEEEESRNSPRILACHVPTRQGSSIHQQFEYTLYSQFLPDISSPAEEQGVEQAEFGQFSIAEFTESSQAEEQINHATEKHHGRKLSLGKIKRNIFPSKDIERLEGNILDNFDLGAEPLVELNDSVVDTSDDDSLITKGRPTIRPLEISESEEEGKQTEQYRQVPPKRHYCVFCRTLYSKISRHLVQVHNAEMVIQNILSLPPNHKERKRTFASLRAQGAKLFYSLQSSPRTLITARRN